MLLADFDSQVRQIVAQPFVFRAEVQAQVRKHIVDYLWGTDDGPVVVDVVRAERMSHPGIALLCAWTRLIVESLGWSYLVVNEPDPVRFHAACKGQTAASHRSCDQPCRTQCS